MPLITGHLTRGLSVQRIPLPQCHYQHTTRVLIQAFQNFVNSLLVHNRPTPSRSALPSNNRARVKTVTLLTSERGDYKHTA